MKRIPVFLCVAVLLGGVSTAARADFIDFDDGTDGLPVGSFYPGVTFSNAQWTGNQGLPGSSGPLGIIPITYDVWMYHWLEANAVIATFNSPTSGVSVVGLDVGMNGLTLNAYDAAVGGNLIASSTVYGLTELGIGEFYTVAVNAPGILRVEMFQPGDTYQDGIILDNFSFGVVPAPSALVLLISGLAGVGAIRRRLCR
jgi:hypothetical protein